MAGADRVPVPGLAVDLATGATIDGVVADEHDGPLRGDQGRAEPTKLAGQVEGRPPCGGGDPLVGGAVAPGQRCGGAGDVGDGAPPGGEEGPAEEGDEPVERRWGNSRVTASSIG